MELPGLDDDRERRLPQALGPAEDPTAEQRRANLEAAERLLAPADGDPTPLERALEQAQVASHWQADSLDLTWEAPGLAADHGRPSEAVFALLERHEVSLTADERADVRALDELPADVAAELADVVDAFAGYEEATERAFADADPAALAELERSTGRERAGGDGLRATGVDLGPVLAARNALLDQVGQLDRAVEANPAIAAGSGPLVNAPPAVAIDTPGTDNTYTEDVALLVDLGGGDAYENNAGGSGLTNGPDALDEDPCDASFFNPVPEVPPGLHAASALVDLGSENDTYGAPGEPGRCGQNGGGHLGAGLVVDAGGDDVYRAGTNVAIPSDCSESGCEAGGSGVNGGGDLGAGMIVDAAGDDAYRAGTDVVVDCPDGNCIAGSGGVNGGAAAGAGTLVDGGGNDRYEAGTRASFDACGALCGAGSFGVNGGAAPGASLLLDTGGNDVYQAGNDARVATCADGGCSVGGFGANGGSNGRASLLVDGGGNDRYVAGTQSTIASCSSGCSIGDTGVNGGTNFASTGTLVDADGADAYLVASDAAIASCTSGGCNVGAIGVNGGSNLGAGALVDGLGDDRYLVADGATLENCTGTCRVGTLGVNGGGNFGLGLLFDGNGNDVYHDDDGGTGDDVTVVPKGLLGAQVDAGAP